MIGFYKRKVAFLGFLLGNLGFYGILIGKNVVIDYKHQRNGGFLNEECRGYCEFL